jgi:hypothetical protein
LVPEALPAARLGYEQVVLDAGGTRVIAGGHLWLWSASGYAGPLPWDRPRAALMLTPPATAAAIAHGYRPQIDPSALG